MADTARPPVAIRIVRPYDSEEEFLESELETVGKTSVILIGAHARPQGVILRFEVTLQSGQIVLRGEGRVLQHKESAFRGQAGLALRFTRLDPKSKALVDRASAIREARLSGSMPPQPVPVPAESSSTPISVPDPEPTPPPLPRPSVESRPPTKPPPAPSDAPPAPLVAMPSFAPMAPPSTIPSNLPGGAHSAAPAAPNATVAPDPMLAQLLTGGTPPPPAASAVPPKLSTAPESDRPTSRPPPGEVMPVEEAKTRPGKVAQLLEESAALEAEPAAPSSESVHATTTVAAPPIRDKEPKELPVPAQEAAAPPAPKVAPPPAVEAKVTTDTAVTRVADREHLLARLRERRASMSDAKKDDILNTKR